MTRQPLARLLALLAALPLVSGCAIGTGWRQQVPLSALPADVALPVSLIHTQVADSHRSPFADHTRKVMDSLPAQPGLVASALRRELIGPNAWVIAVWASEDDRDRFVAGAVHQRAIAAAAPGLRSLTIKRLALKPSELPVDWARAKALLAAAP
jgi:hypothetical protein